MRSKIFPNSPFSGDETDHSRSPSPTTRPAQKKRARSTTHSLQSPEPDRRPSPGLSSAPLKEKAIKGDTHDKSLARSRSRSLSVSLAQERDQRANSIGAGPKRRVLNREVSMSRVFKPKPKASNNVAAEEDAKRKGKVKKVPDKVVLAEKDKGVTLVEATPVKARVLSKSQSQLGVQKLKFTGTSSTLLALREEKEEIWDLPSSPDVMLLCASNSAGFSDEEDTKDGV